ncbi:hypothetical protein [Kribbella solani]|uniref:hypothetical protein n=1 Tax=Kribbella solani TaxID=236067 RepID=UPI001EE2F048|nr:hypothetical protein [Kribbella solani]
MPTVEWPLRVAEFDQLFATALRAVEWRDAMRLLLVLDAGAQAAARELTDRETGCCSFFSFTFAPAGDGTVHLKVGVPPAHSAVLGAPAARAGEVANSSRISEIDLSS